MIELSALANSCAKVVSPLLSLMQDCFRPAERCEGIYLCSVTGSCAFTVDKALLRFVAAKAHTSMYFGTADAIPLQLQDQVMALQALGIRAAMLSSSDSREAVNVCYCVFSGL